MFSSTVTLLGPQNRVLVSFSSIQCMLLHVLWQDRFSFVCSSKKYLLNFFYVHDTSLVPVTDKKTL